MTKKEVLTSFQGNDDGAGVAWYPDKEHVSYRKGFMKVQHLVDFYFDEHINTKLPHVVHFRRASNLVIQKLTHPFIVSEKSPLKLTYNGKDALLFHNGVVSNWRKQMLDFYIHNTKKIPDGEFSDSRFVSILTHFLGPNILHILGDKFVLFSTEKINVYGEWEEDDNGIIATNDSYKTGRVVLTQSQLRNRINSDGITHSNDHYTSVSVIDDVPGIYDGNE
jgi:hypothetical protein